jgi:hypothetical protein
MKIRIHKCGTIVCFYNKNTGFAISNGLNDVIPPRLGEIKLFCYDEFKHYWFDL